MKQHLSIPMLLIRSSFHWVLLILLLLTVGNGAIFLLIQGSNWPRELMAGTVGFELLVDQHPYRLVFFLCQMLLLIPLTTTFNDKHNKLSYTLRRLSVTEKQTALWHWAYGTCCYIMLWAIQTVLMTALGQWYLSIAPSTHVNHQTLMLAFYQSDFLHGMVPLADKVLWARNILTAVALSGVCANYAHGTRRGIHRDLSLRILVFLLLYSFLRLDRYTLSMTAQSTNLVSCAVFLLYIFYVISCLNMKEVEKYDKQKAA